MIATKEAKQEIAFKNYEKYLRKNCNKKQLIGIILNMYEKYNPDSVVRLHLKNIDKYSSVA